jgi:hypothetical protein
MIEKREQRKEDRIRSLLQYVHKLYTIALMNPLHPVNGKVKNDEFLSKVVDLVKEYTAA